MTVHKTSSNTQASKSATPLEWLAAYGDEMLLYTASRIQPFASAEDVVQTTLLTAIDSYSGFRGDSSVRTWLFSILRRKIVDHYRMNSRQKNVVPLDSEEHSCGGKNGLKSAWPRDPSSDLEAGEFWEVYNACLSKLSGTASVVFVLREMDHKTTEEICNILDISPTNVSVRLHRARMGLRDCLEQNWFSGGKDKS